MALDDIEAKIKGQGRAQIKELKASAREEMREISRQSEAESRRRCDKTEIDFRKKSVALRGSILSTARLRASNMVELEKARVLEQVFVSAREKALKLPAGGKRKILADMLESRSLIGGDVVVSIGKEYANLLPKAKGVVVRKQEIGDFGLVIASKDNSIRIDRRLNTVLAELSEKIKPELCGILFNGK